MKQLLAIGAVATLAMTSLHLDPPQAARTPDSWVRVQGEASRAPKTVPVLRWRDAQLPAYASSKLDFAPLLAKRLQAVKARNRQASSFEPLQVGVSRLVGESAQKALPALKWAATPDGGAATRIVVNTTDAKGLRVGLRLLSLDPRMELRFAGSNAPDTVAARISGHDALALVDSRSLFWTPSTEGRSQVIEVYAPKGVSVRNVRLQVPSISHLFAVGSDGFKFEKDIGDSGSCNVDTVCRVNELGQHFVNAKNAVAHMQFIAPDDTGQLGTYICTGTLLGDTDDTTQLPYFYTANHCIGTQTIASTLETYWRFEATACGSQVPAANVRVAGGSTLLYADELTDAALLRLNQAPPSGSFFAGWDSAPLPDSTAITAIHHPSGDLKKVSTGQKVTQDDELHYVGWTSGTTEGGSSGSGLFTNNANGYYLRGGLYGGSASCANSGNLSNPDNRDLYSRLDVVYPNIRQYLAPPVQVVPTRRDFNYDGKADVFWRNSATGGNDIWRSANAATRQPTPSVPLLAWQVVGVGDFNGDSKADVLWRNATTGANDIWLSAVSTTRQPIQAEASSAWRVAGVGDFNADNRDDIFWRNITTGGTGIWPSANRSLSEARAAIPDQNWQVAGVGDFNNDNRDDILWRNNATGANELWRSGTHLQRQVLLAVNTAWKIVGVADFNRDGASDILWRNSTTGQNVIWRSANYQTQQAVATVADQNWKVAQVGDFNGDGYADILWRNGATGYNDLWRSAMSTQRSSLARVSDLNWKVIP